MPGVIRVHFRPGKGQVRSMDPHSLLRIHGPGGRIPHAKIRPKRPRISPSRSIPFPGNPVNRPVLVRMENRLKSCPVCRNTPDFDAR